MKDNKVMKYQLITQSFFPLYLILLIKCCDQKAIDEGVIIVRALFDGDWLILIRMFSYADFGAVMISVLSFFMLILSGIAFFQFKDVQNSGFKDYGDKVKIEEELSDRGVGFFMTYVFPLLLDDLRSFRGFLVFILVYFIIFLLLWRTNLYYQNPILTILGYKTYKVCFVKYVDEIERVDGEKGEYIAISHSILNEEKIIKYKEISNNVMLVYNK